MQIYPHDSPEAIAYKNNYMELENWIDQLHYMEKEILNLINLGNTEFTPKLILQPVLSKLERKKEENKLHLQALLLYQEDLPKAAECEDVACDMFYVTEHDKFRKDYLKHLEKYRNIKEEYFSVLIK